nr:protein lin-28 homolog B isoform X2 [Caretta caretta]
MAEAGASKGGDEPGKLPEQEEEESQVLHGTGHCKWFNVRMGFGFISMINREGNPLESPVDVFVHQITRKLCSFLLDEDLATMIQACIISRLDYYNSLYLKLSGYSAQAELVQHVSACFLHGSDCCEHIRPVLKSLHWLWLPVSFLYQFKALVLIIKALNGSSPSYIKDGILICEPQQQLCSSGTMQSTKPRMKHVRVRDKAFSVEGIQLWSNLPKDIRGIEDL